MMVTMKQAYCNRGRSMCGWRREVYTVAAEEVLYRTKERRGVAKSLLHSNCSYTVTFFYIYYSLVLLD